MESVGDCDKNGFIGVRGMKGLLECIIKNMGTKKVEKEGVSPCWEGDEKMG